ncbi:MAG: UDP-N-acetylglucosamine--N-acetylmuramyl-(pentapeptide) pyrophosphoryl-undecaprenol N-acetylglucosamine transferase [Lentimicrobium sp.]|nr:UDP-N-acetylglucosamine--N-acetylmuramyl-(pentapeptide) pyrophosphoryl-undecaprenol N-acetylglucosamine transferase [Lentimicrobium sp.]
MHPSAKPRILICPLDWGLGHATRCIPLIRALKAAGAEVVIAADGPQLILLQNEFPDCEWIEFPGYNIKYSKKGNVGLKLIFTTPALLLRIISEHFRLKSLIKEYRIDAVVSDNRYGLWNKKVRTVFITHQFNIIAPSNLGFTEPFLRYATRFFARKYDESWIPDLEGEHNLSGKLSHGFSLPANSSYIGLLSRFDFRAKVLPGKQYDVVAIVSGPEPQRSIFEDILLKQLPLEGKKCLIIRGIPGNTSITSLRSNLDKADHLSSGQMQSILSGKPVVISRPGYSTLMDIAFTHNKAVLVPTPGQTEQEYLSKHLVEKRIYYSCKQENADLEKAFEALVHYKPELPFPVFPMYSEKITQFLSILEKPEY